MVLNAPHAKSSLSQFDSMNTDKSAEDDLFFGGDTRYYVVSDDDQPDTPTDLYGIWLGIAVFGGILLLSVFIVGGLMYFSRKQEKAREEKRIGMLVTPYRYARGF